MASAALPTIGRDKIGYIEPKGAGTTQELRVLQLFSVLGLGGAETWLMSLLKYFHEARKSSPVNVKFDVLLTGGAKAVFDDAAVDLGANLFYVPFGRGNAISFTREFRRILARGHYDAIHDHQDYIAGVHFLMGAGHLPPIRIAHVHNPLYHRASQAGGIVSRIFRSTGKRLLASFATHIMGTSRQIIAEYGFNDSLFDSVALGAAHCGFDVTQYQSDPARAHAKLCAELGWDESARIILFVGRLESAEGVHQGRRMTHKNPALALEIVKACVARDRTIHLAMVGAGDTKRMEFKALVREWGLVENVQLLGERHDVPQLMLASDLLLFPSLAEGLGMVVVEAQAAGLRVLASDTTPRECVVVPELVTFQPLSSDAAAWAEEALRLIGMPKPNSARCNLAVRNSAFSIENSAARLVQLYSSAQRRDPTSKA
jgi:glycosyltransferase involved in cell wall biosynthesis